MKKVVDLFCGCGGFSEGFHLANFKIISAIDHWETARKSIAMNHGENVIPDSAKKYNFDIEKISKLPDKEFHEIIPDSEVIIGSPPCVSFSNSNKSGYANKNLGIRLIESFMRIVARKQNKKDSILESWIMENVPKSKHYVKDEYTFKSNDPEQKYVGQKKLLKIKVIKKSEYDLKDYGVPSNRSRFLCGDFQEPIKAKDIESKKYHLGNILKMLQIKKGKTQIQDPIWGDLSVESGKITDHDYVWEIPEWSWLIAKRHKRDKGYMGQMSFPENMDKVARTIMAFATSQSREAFILPYSKNRYRKPTIREYATLMSFPINYQFSGVSHCVKKKQVGNAVPPKFSFELARAIQDLKRPNSRRLQKGGDTNGDFRDLKNDIFDIKPQKTRRFKIIFDQQIPYLKINAYRTVLDNRESDWHNRKIKWKASIHKGAGHYKTLQPSLKLCDDYFKLTKKQLNIIEKLKLRKGTELNLHNNYRTTLDKRRKDKLLGPNELLASIKDKLLSPKYKKIKNFSLLEKHDANNYGVFSFVEPKTKIEYLIPEPILLGYYCLRLIFKK